MVNHGTREERVARGAQFLDAVVPGWERCIDLETLQLAFSHKCICGQVFEQASMNTKIFDGYHIAKTLFTEGQAWSRELVVHEDFSYADMVSADLGFSLSPEEVACAKDTIDPLAPYVPLQETWTILIKERFNTGALSDA